MTLRSYLQPSRVQGPKHSELLHTTWGCSDPPNMNPKMWKTFIPSDLQQLQDQQQQFTEASHLQDKNSLPSLPPAPVTSFTLFCSYKVVPQWQRKKKKKNTLNISSSKKPIDRQILWIPPSTAIFELRTS